MATLAVSACSALRSKLSAVKESHHGRNEEYTMPLRRQLRVCLDILKVYGSDWACAAEARRSPVPAKSSNHLMIPKLAEDMVFCWQL